MPELLQNLRNAVMNQAIAWARSLERIERGRNERERGECSRPVARAIVARRLGIGPGTFANLVFNRVKSVPAALRDRIYILLKQELENEAARCISERDDLIRGGEHPCSDEVLELDAALATARSILRRMAQG